MSAIDQLFARLRKEKRKAFMPFITAGDPNLEFTAKLLVELVARGASMFEVGIPYSDPIADGPVVQASYTRALKSGVKVADIWKMLSTVTPRLAAPLVTMVSYATIHRRGLRQFVAEAQAAGIAGAIVPDLLVEESSEFSAICRDADFSLIHLVTPTTPPERAVRIAEASTGFLYYVSVTGITGERTALPQQLVENVGWLKRQTDLPICIGFGINRPEHVRLLAPVADGLIVGSGIVRRIADGVDEPADRVIAQIGQYVVKLVEALEGSR